MRDLMSYLTKLTEDFLAYQNFSDNVFSSKLYLLRALREKELYNEIPPLEKSIRQLLKKQWHEQNTKLYLNE